MVTEDCSTHAKQEDQEEGEMKLTKEEAKKGDWSSVATRLLALCGGLEQYDGVEGVGWRAQERRKIRLTERRGSLPRTPELVRRAPSTSFSEHSMKTRTLPRDRSQSSNLISVPPMTRRTRSFGEVNIGSCEIDVINEMSDAQIRTTTL